MVGIIAVRSDKKKCDAAAKVSMVVIRCNIKAEGVTVYNKIQRDIIYI